MLLEDGPDSDLRDNPAVRLVLGSPILTRIKHCEGIFDKKHPKKRFAASPLVFKNTSDFPVQISFVLKLNRTSRSRDDLRGVVIN